MSKYSIGLDFGTLSARGLIVDTANGREMAVSEFVYPHAVMTEKDFTDIKLSKTDAFQHPQDYLDSVAFIIKDLINKTNISPDDIVGIGIDFTSCTVMPVKSDGTPLCFLEKFKNNPQSYVKLWKHHSAEAEAVKITELAKELGEKWIDAYGGKVSSEWLFPKLLETLDKAEGVYFECDRFMEAGDWLVWQLTGNEVHSTCMAGYKALWNKTTSYPSNEFWGRLNKDFGNIIGTKVSLNVKPTGTKAGEISKSASEFSGLKEGTAVAVPIIDAHSALPAAGIVDEGKLMIIAGTSSCHIVMDKNDIKVKGICGSVTDGIIPGFVAYEAGQACVGDSFDWFIKNCVPSSYEKEALNRGLNIFDYLTQKAQELSVGQSGLIALDWWNGNRTPYADYDLTGTIIGLNLQTKPEEIYRAILESTAYGTKSIIDLYEENGIKVNEIYVAGGIAQKNQFMMQMYADVLNKEIKIASSTQAGAKGSAIFASVAGGAFTTVTEAAKIIADKSEICYMPNVQNTVKYQKLYTEYKKLSDFLAKSDIMKNLKNI